MANIIGKPFSQFVTAQIQQRQTILGQTKNYSADDLKYITGKTPWLRLASSVNLTGKRITRTAADGSQTSALDDSVLSKLIRAGVDKNLITGNRLAKNFILQGGSISLSNNQNNEYAGTESTNANSNASLFKLQKGLNYGEGNIFEGAYGWGGVSERGYVPMPGIENASTTYYNNGALSKTTVTIKCFSKAQFQLLDVLYLRPGYSLLLEFGWSAYMTNIGSLETFPGFKTQPLDFLLDPESFDGVQNQFFMYDLIQKERKRYAGNYEGVYGKITNFKWNFGSDGSYTCTVDIIGMGSVIESLKLNVTDPERGGSNKSKSQAPEPIDTENEYLEVIFGTRIGRKIANGRWPKFADSNDKEGLVEASKQPGGSYALTEDASVEDIKSYAKVLYDNYVEEQQNENDINEKNADSNPLLSNKDETALNRIFFKIYQNFVNKGTTAIGYTNAFGIKRGSFLLHSTFNGEQSSGGGDKVMQSVWIKFGVLLKIIERRCNLFSKKGGSKGTPTIQFDFNYGKLDTDQNYMLIIPPNLSANPQKCIVPWTKMSIPGILQFKGTIDGDIPTTEENSSQGWTGKSLNEWLQMSDFLVEDNPYVGRLGNMLVNLRFCAASLETAPRDDDGAISVLGYVQTILEGISESMGSINKFKVTVDENDGLVKIIDEAPKPGLVKNPEEQFAKFNIFGMKTPLEKGQNADDIGVTSKQASFITNLSLNAEIPKNFATMLAIGAQASGNNLQGNSTSFSNYNKGLIDRIIPEKIDYVELKDKSKDSAVVGTHPVKMARDIKIEKLYFKSTNDKISPFDAVYTRNGSLSGNLKYFDFSPNVTGDFTENYTSYLKLAQGILTDDNKVPQPFFLPFNLSLEMEGLSGMKLFEKFRITDDILPPSYNKDTVDIIIKGINHNVTINGWTTTLNTLSVPRMKDETIEFNEVVENDEEELNETQEKVKEANEEKPETGPEEEKILRLRLTRLSDDGYQTFGMMEVLDPNGNLLYALATVELPWNDNKSGDSCVPLGTYDLAYRFSPKHKDCFIIVDEGTKQTGNKNEPYKKGLGIYKAPQNKAPRGYVLIHKATAAKYNNGKNILEGCIAPGLHFNTNQNIDSTGKPDSNGNPRGLGPQHGTPNGSKSGIDTKAAVAQLLGTLKETGLNPGFKMEIRALDEDNGKPFTDWFYDDEPQEFITAIEAKTGAKYTYLT